MRSEKQVTKVHDNCCFEGVEQAIHKRLLHALAPAKGRRCNRGLRCYFNQKTTSQRTFSDDNRCFEGGE